MASTALVTPRTPSLIGAYSVCLLFDSPRQIEVRAYSSRPEPIDILMIQTRTDVCIKSVYFRTLNSFSKNGSPEQTTMLMRLAAKFCVEPRSPSSEIFHQDPKTFGTLLIIVSCIHMVSSRLRDLVNDCKGFITS